MFLGAAMFLLAVRIKSYTLDPIRFRTTRLNARRKWTPWSIIRRQSANLGKSISCRLCKWDSRRAKESARASVYVIIRWNFLPRRKKRALRRAADNALGPFGILPDGCCITSSISRKPVIELAKLYTPWFASLLEAASEVPTFQRRGVGLPNPRGRSRSIRLAEKRIRPEEFSDRVAQKFRPIFIRQVQRGWGVSRGKVSCESH